MNKFFIPLTTLVLIILYVMAGKWADEHESSYYSASSVVHENYNKIVEIGYRCQISPKPKEGETEIEAVYSCMAKKMYWDFSLYIGRQKLKDNEVEKIHSIYRTMADKRIKHRDSHWPKLAGFVDKITP